MLSHKISHTHFLSLTLTQTERRLHYKLNPHARTVSLSLLLCVESKMAAVPAVAVNGVKVGSASPAYLESKAVKDTKSLISDLCRQFYNLGWVSGTGGSITIKVHDDSIPKPHQLIVMSPSGVLLFLNLCYYYFFGFWVIFILARQLVFQFLFDFLGLCCSS